MDLLEARQEGGVWLRLNGRALRESNGAPLNEPFVDLGIVTVCVEKGNECDADTFVSRERMMVAR